MSPEVAREVLLKHSRSDKNGVFPDTFTLEAKMTNPVCGDHVELRLYTEKNTVIAIGHKASACAICSASASLLCEEVKGKEIELILKLGQIFERGVMEPAHLPWPEEISNLVCFEHLRVNPARKMCAILPWVVLKSALKPRQ